MITSIMAGFAFGYCVADIIIGYYKRKQTREEHQQIIDQELNQ